MASQDSMVQSAATRLAFRHGQQIYAGGGVSSWTQEPAPAGAAQQARQSVSLAGEVAEDGRQAFRPRLTLDLSAGRVASHSCDCPAGRAPGLCKHCVALALAYLDGPAGAAAGSGEAPAPDAAPEPAAPRRPARPARGAGAPLAAAARERLRQQTSALVEQYRAEAQSSARGRGPAPAAIQEPRTSPAVGPLVLAYARQGSRAAEARAEAAGERPEEAPVELEASLAPAGRAPGGGRAWALTLHISRGQTSYLVRRIDELVDAWEDGATASYGRGLVVEHAPRAFSERARAVLGVVERALRSQQAGRSSARALARSEDAAQQARAAGSPRELLLSDLDAADLLDALQGSQVAFETRAPAGGSRRRTLEVREADPVLPLRVTANRRGGYDLEVPGDYECVSCPGRMYLLTEDAAARCSDAYREAMAPFCRALLPTRAPVHVRAEDMGGLCGAVLPRVLAHARAELPEGLESFAPKPARLSFRLSARGGVVACRAEASYGDESVGVFEPLREGQPVRDLAKEGEAQGLVRAYFGRALAAGRDAGPAEPWGPADPLPEGALPCFDASDAEAAYRFLSEGLPALARLGQVLADDALRRACVRPAPRVRVSARVSGGVLDLSMDFGGLAPEDVVACLEAYRRKERYVVLTGGDVARLGSADGMKALGDLAELLGVSPAEVASGKARVPANRALFVDAVLGRADDVELDGDASFEGLVGAFESMGSREYPDPRGLRGSLRPYQREGYRWMRALADFGFGGILADDMGLGKTIQLIAFLLAQHEEGRAEPSLVVCPASLVYNWMDELARFAPGLACCPVVGPRDDRARLVRTARGYDVLVTSYDLLKRDIDLYAQQGFYCLALDEAQYIKNPSTQTARCAKRVRAQVRLALTGTPIENRLGELWSIFDFLMPGLLGGADSFRRAFELPASEGDAAAQRRLSRMVAPFVLRRMKSDVLQDLPDKTEGVVSARMEGEQDRLYRATAARLAMTLSHQMPSDFARERIAVLAELTKLRQICCDPHLLYEDYDGPSAKLECALELVANAVDGGHKVLLFSQFTSMLGILGKRLSEAGTAYHSLTGATPKEERARLVESFASDDVPVFLISLKAGGVGLNLTAADIVIHYDPWWNLAAQNQATDRAYRIGQSKDVSVYRIICQGTIEERIVRLQETKRDLAESVLGGDAQASGKLTKEAVLALIGLDGEE